VAPAATHDRHTTEHSYLLRVIVVGVARSRRYVIQDLRSGERHDFDTDEALRRFLRAEGPRHLR
jgi:hypothetical protein